MQRYHISIHPPLAGRDRALCVPTFCGNHFNPPAPCGAGLHTIRYTYRGDHFNPPAPCGAGRDRASPEGRQTDFNPPAPCGAGPPLLPLLPQLFPISIHPPLAGRDSAVIIWRSLSCISIHPPLAGRDCNPLPRMVSFPHFNPPAPCGAGPLTMARRFPPRHFNPPAPCGAGLNLKGLRYFLVNFNPPAPCGAGRSFGGRKPRPRIFQSTRPLRGGTTGC